ncbi:Ldh family oxidoreductase [Natrialbaceae archaeon A-chndr2]
MAIHHGHHFGMAAYYTLYAAERGCIGLAMSHGAPRVAPFGGIDPFFGTSPIAYSVPTSRGFHITLDMSTSVSANAKVRHAREEETAIPDGWAMDMSGAPTTDPTSVHALRPIGGAKGYGLGLLVELCTGLLAGMGFAPEVDTPFDDYSKPMHISHLLVSFDINAFRNVSEFKADVSELTDRLKSVQAANGVDVVRLPGEQSALIATERERNGIPIDQSTKEQLSEVGNRYGIDFPC